MRKTLLGFDFDGVNKTLWLEEAKREKLITVLKGWIRTASRERGIEFGEFRSVIQKIRHAFKSIPQGVALLSPCNRILKVEPMYVTCIGTNSCYDRLKGVEHCCESRSRNQHGVENW
jgi:hypothetical protein